MPLWRFTQILLIFFMLVTLACVAPVRVPKQDRGIDRQSVGLDLTFLKPGSTTRDEITKKLAAIDTGVTQNNLFWGRWESSKWRLVGPGGNERDWHLQNLLVQFDRGGIVKRWVVTDDKGIGRQLELLAPVADDSPLDLAS